MAYRAYVRPKLVNASRAWSLDILSVESVQQCLTKAIYNYDPMAFADRLRALKSAQFEGYACYLSDLTIWRKCMKQEYSNLRTLWEYDITV